LVRETHVCLEIPKTKKYANICRVHCAKGGSLAFVAIASIGISIGRPWAVLYIAPMHRSRLGTWQ
jgi:hypothetical protein